MLIANLLFTLALSTLAAEPKREFNGPAVDDYKTTAADFAMFEKAAAGALSLEKTLFSAGVGEVDLLIQDTEKFYLYSRNRKYPYKKLKTWRGYQVYVFGHRRPREHEMWGCAAGVPDAMEVDDRRVVAERLIRCAPWGSFRAAQVRKKDAVYAQPEGYLATLIHEYGHAYEDIKRNDPSPDMTELSRRLDEAQASPEARREAFAQLCELQGAKTLYPAHFKRLLAEAKKKRSKPDGHGTALAVAASMLGR